MECIKEAKNLIIKAGKLNNARLEDVAKSIKKLYDTTTREIKHESCREKEKRKK